MSDDDYKSVPAKQTIKYVAYPRTRLSPEREKEIRNLLEYTTGSVTKQVFLELLAELDALRAERDELKQYKIAAIKEMLCLKERVENLRQAVRIAVDCDEGTNGRQIARDTLAADDEMETEK